MKFRCITRAAFLVFPLSLAAEEAAPDTARGEGEGGEPSVELQEILVIGTKTERPWIDSSGSITRIGRDDLTRSGTNDLGGIAKYDPSISTPYDFASGDGAFGYGGTGYGGFNIRGTEGNRVAIELDGIRQPPQYVSTSFDMGGDDGAGGVGRDYFDPAMFELVEVLKGGGSALYGSDALGGVVSFRTPEPEDLIGEGNAGGFLRTQYFSVNESLAGQVGGAVRQGDASFLLLYSGREGEETANRGTLPPNPAEFTGNSILAKMNYTAGEHVFRLALESFERDTWTDARSAATSPFPVFNKYVINEQHLERQRASLRWEYEPAGAWIDRLETQAFYQIAESQSDNASASKPLVIGGNPIPGTERTRDQRITFGTEIYGLSTLAKREIDTSWAKHALLAGFEWSSEESVNTFTRVDSGMPAQHNRTSFAPTTTDRAGFYLQDEIRAGEHWLVTPGLRFDYQTVQPDLSPEYLERLAQLGRFAQDPAEDYDNFAISPRLSVAYKPTPETQIYLTYAHGIRNPSAEELSMIFDHPPSGTNPVGSLTVPNPDLLEERSDAFELGYKAESELGRLQVAGYYTRYEDFIENGASTGRVDDDGRDILTSLNRGRVDIYGFEVQGTLQLGELMSQAKGWSVGLNTGKSIGTNRTDDLPLNSIEPWKTVGFLGYDSPAGNYGFRFAGTYTAAVDRTNDTTDQGRFFRPGEWFTLDFGGYWKPTDTLTVNAGVNNLFDEKYWNWGSVRRGNGHLGGNATTDRGTAPGTNFFLSLTQTF